MSLTAAVAAAAMPASLQQHDAHGGYAMIELRQFHIDGRWVAARAPGEHVLVDATSEEQFGVVALAGDADVDAAVAAARKAFPSWAATDPAIRLAYVEKMREIHLSRTEDMAKAISQEMGAPIDLARAAQSGAGPRHLANFIAAMKDFDFLRPLGRPRRNARARRASRSPVGG